MFQELANYLRNTRSSHNYQSVFIVFFSKTQILYEYQIKSKSFKKHNCNQLIISKDNFFVTFIKTFAKLLASKLANKFKRFFNVFTVWSEQIENDLKSFCQKTLVKKIYLRAKILHSPDTFIAITQTFFQNFPFFKERLYLRYQFYFRKKSLLIMSYNQGNFQRL